MRFMAREELQTLAEPILSASSDLIAGDDTDYSEVTDEDEGNAKDEGSIGSIAWSDILRSLIF